MMCLRLGSWLALSACMGVSCTASPPAGSSKPEADAEERIPPPASSPPVGRPIRPGTAPFDEQLEHDGPESQLANCSSSPSGLSRQQLEAFAWFDRLGFPDIRCRKFVTVTTGRTVRTGDDPPRSPSVPGFLLGDDGREFTVLTVDLTIQTFNRTGPTVEAHERVGYQVHDLSHEVPQIRSWLTMGRAEPRLSRWTLRMGERLAGRAELFILARAAAGRGRSKVARDLWDEGVALQDRQTGQLDPPPLAQAVRDDIAHSLTWRSYEDFGDLTIARARLWAKLEWLLALGSSKHRARNTKLARVLRQMVAEDQEHARHTRPLEQLTKAERIDELIFRLRGQNGHQGMQPGRCDIFDDPRGEASPAHQLVALGYDAVPKLIDALADTRPSRSVGYHRAFYFSHYVLTVGDCARAVLERIAERRFYSRSSTRSEMSTDREEQAVREAVQRWWSTVRRPPTK